MAATEHNTGNDKAREHLARARSYREDMRRSGDAVVRHLRRAAELRREAARAARNGR